MTQNNKRSRILTRDTSKSSGDYVWDLGKIAFGVSEEVRNEKGPTKKDKRAN